MKFDATIIGGGAAGLFCAVEAAKRGRRVAVLERNHQPGRKILISGGGRSNFTNLNVTAENFVSQNPHFAKSALARYTPQDFIGLVKKHKIAFYEKKLGQLFCRGRSQEIVDMLLAECRAAGVKVFTACDVKNVDKNAKFEVETNVGRLESDVLVVAAGGLSFPKVGATDIGYRIAKHFGLKIVEPQPSLVPLTLKAGKFGHLAGISADAAVSTAGASFREMILFTHRGLSGPAILQISNYWRPGSPVEIDLLPNSRLRELVASGEGAAKHLDNFAGAYLPAKLVSAMLGQSGGGKVVSEMTDGDLIETENKLHHWSVIFSGTEGYDKAEVTRGGVSTAELSSQTMESRSVEGLYFIGEVVDVTGWLGGYNFQWAWSSGFAAGTAL